MRSIQKVHLKQRGKQATRNDGLGNTTIAAGLKSVTVFGAKLTSTQGNPVRVTGLTFNFTGSTDLVNNAYRLLHSDMVGELQNRGWQQVLVKRNTPENNVDQLNGNAQEHFGGNSGILYRQF